MTFEQLLKRHEAIIVYNSSDTYVRECRCDASVGNCPCESCADADLYRDLAAALTAMKGNQGKDLTDVMEWTS